jgi:hypothetical protein
MFMLQSGLALLSAQKSRYPQVEPRPAPLRWRATQGAPMPSEGSLHAHMWACRYVDVSASGDAVEVVLLEKQIDRLFAQRLGRGLRIERKQP